MKKQSGFTLIELMVVMAIIAILATAGLSAYTGYIKKARDTTRISDLAAINTIILADMSTDGLPPDTVANLRTAITTANNGQPILDPHQTASGTEGSVLCFTDQTATTLDNCSYYYQTCSSGTQYRVMARFESAANQALYNAKAVGTGQSCAQATANDCDYYAVGTCLGTAVGVTTTPPTDAGAVI